MSEPKHPEVYDAVQRHLRGMLLQATREWVKAKTKVAKSKISAIHMANCQPWLSLLKQVENGITSPMDAYDYLKLGIVPDYALV